MCYYRKSSIFGEKNVGVAGLEPKQIQSSKQELLGPTKRNSSHHEIEFRFFMFEFVFAEKILLNYYS